jgi:serine/threonine protein kinase
MAALGFPAMSIPSLQSLASLAAERPLKIEEALGVLRDAAKALAALHAAGSVHGAVCAENIVLDENGQARLCKDAPRPRYPSPEQSRGETRAPEGGTPSGGHPDARSDVYGLGATFAEVLRGEPLPEPIRRLLATMTAAGPARRYRSMDEVLTALDVCEMMTGRRGRRPGHEADATRPHRRLLPFAIALLALAMLGLALAMILAETPPARGTPPESQEQLLEKMVPLTPEPATPAKR